MHLTIVTPERALVDEQVDEIQVPGAAGYLGILPGHAPLFAELHVGELSYRRGSQWIFLAVAWGFVEVLHDDVRVLAETAERASEIDVERATKARERAERRLREASFETDYERASDSLQRASIRIQVGRKSQVTV